MRSGILLVAMLCAACAQTPSEPTERTPATSPAQAADSAAAQPAAAAEAAASADAAEAAAAAEKPPPTKDIPSGYHAMEKNGQLFYCTDTPAMGTRIRAKRTCVDAEQFDRQRQDAKDKMRQKQGATPYQE